jgi:hypothetical protein
MLNCTPSARRVKVRQEPPGAGGLEPAVHVKIDRGAEGSTIVYRSKVMTRAGTPAQKRSSLMRNTALFLMLLLAAAATAVAFDRVVVCEDAYAEY